MMSREDKYRAEIVAFVASYVHDHPTLDPADFLQMVVKVFTARGKSFAFVKEFFDDVRDIYPYAESPSAYL